MTSRSTHPPTPRRMLRASALAVATVGLSLAGTAAASAHVRVHADSTTTGSFSALTFRVPTESDTASTVEVSVQLPQDTPFLYVSTKPIPGWRATATEETLPKPVDSEGTTITKAIRTVTWTATDQGAQIKPGQYQEFSISAGPLPAAGSVALPATQTYSNGEIVRWDQPTPASGEEPEYPAPALVVTAAGSESAPPAAPSTPSADAVGSAQDATARGLAAGALVVAVAGLVLAALGLRPRRVTP